jgi:phenylpropionate dioxygenase-like ring-hydroxylating dioxygenase large terminal subunit
VTPLDDRLTRGFWHLVGHRSELAEPGDWLKLDWPLGELTLWNDAGEVIAFDNLCPHRGTRLFVEPAGNGRAVCPYHGWSYREGQMRIPRTADLAACDRERATLNRYQTAWQGDFLFVGVAPETPLAEQLGGLGATLAAIGGDIDGRRDLNAYDYACDWRVAIENALESDHVNLIHPESLAQLALDAGSFGFSGPHSTWTAGLCNGRMVKGLKAMRRLFDTRWDHEGYTNLYVFPFAMLSTTFGYSWSLQTFFPAPVPGMTRFCSRLLAGRAVAEGMLDGFFESAAAINRQVFAEDAAICARISPAYDLASPNRIFTASEARLRHFQATLVALT